VKLLLFFVAVALSPIICHHAASLGAQAMHARIGPCGNGLRQ